MNECFGRYFILNGELQPADLFNNSMVYEGESVYEVLRIVRGIPLFFNEHAARLGSSAKFQNKPVLADQEWLRKDILSLLAAEMKPDINLKIVFNYGNGKANRLVYYIEPLYPSPEQYRKGVKGILYSAERKDPESKVINHILRSEIYHRLIMENSYEALLVNRDNCITEGSRSNIFFIKGETLFTAPGKAVLHGITRGHIIDICRENKIEIEFECIRTDRLKEYESVFMSGTSPVVLPFSRIGEIRFKVNHPMLSFLRKQYLKKAEGSRNSFTDPGGHFL